MIQDKLGNIFKKGLPTALLEVALIFIGITLAIGFENWNTERNERVDELALLTELKANLEENLVQLAKISDFNNQTIASFETMLAHIVARKPYSDDLSDAFGWIDNWASPYLTSSAYETLKARGLDTISESSLRQQIVSLFDVQYADLVNDYDRSEWINLEVSTLPLQLKHIEILANGVAVPVDYDALLDDRAFRVGILRSLELRKSGIVKLQRSAEATRQLIASISEIISD
jgi:hypothetical protein